MSLSSLTRLAGLQSILLAAAVICIDVVSYIWLPNSIAWKFPAYRKASNVAGENRGYPIHYFQPHPKRGFDISPNAKGTHSFDDYSYPVWSNGIGCFDHERENAATDYYYFAGDSFTWGYAKFEDKFATLFEAITGIPSLKCGVTGTGTRHQFEKFIDVSKIVGRHPKMVIVSYYPNDIAEDFIHPQKTVVAGHLVVDTFIDDSFSPVRVDSQWLQRNLLNALQIVKVEKTCSTGIKEWVGCHSVVANLVVALIRKEHSRTDAIIKPVITLPTYNGKSLKHPTNIENVYATKECLDCNSQSFSKPNMDAMRDWQAHAKANNYKLVVMLIPPRYAHGQVGFYSGFIARLNELGIETLDLAAEFRQRGLGVHNIYWRRDGHFSPSGNRAAAEALVRRWGK